MRAPQVKGLFLSGGQSQRMGTDKALLSYDGRQTEIERWKNIFDGLGLPLYWSQRPGQYTEGLFPSLPRLVDQNPGAGPLAALMSAHQQAPESAWLVLACDWPLLRSADILHLLQNRRPEMPVTTYVYQGRREPLCSLYEPAFLQDAEQAWQAGQQSLYRLLEASAAWEVCPLNAARFINANDPAARQQSEETVRKRSSRSHPHQSDH